MRKLFLFATVAAAGLFAGCSSSDDVVDAGNSAIENVGDSKTAIKIGISNIVNMETRGTGTVGGVGTGDNYWAGQHINVFMFDKISTIAADAKLKLTTEADPTDPTATVAMYDNRDMITPGSPENLIPGENPDADGYGEAMIENGDIKYYPYSGNFDFFGYHIDDAAKTGAVAHDGASAEASTKWWVEFAIDGSQDLMSAKAKLTETYNYADPSNPVLNGGQKYDINQNPTSYGLQAGDSWEDFTRYYSAYSARKSIQPTLTFDHLLTRLQFKVKAGNASSAGYGDDYILDHYSLNNITAAQATELATASVTLDTYFEAVDGDGNRAAKAAYANISKTDYNDPASIPVALKAYCTPHYVAGQDPTRAVMVDTIKVLSKTDGKLLVAWTNDATMDAHKKIEWDAISSDADKTWLALQERQYATLNANETIDDADIDTKPAIIARLEAEIAQLDPVNDAQEISDKQDLITNFWSKISKETYDNLVTTADKGQNKYTKLNANGANDLLIPLNPTAPLGYTTISPWAVNEDKYTSVGEALIVAPNEWTGTAYTAADLKMAITVSQRVPANWNDYNADPTKLETKYQTYYLDIPYPQADPNKKGSGAFMCNTSYNVILTVYGYNRIEIMTEVNPWEAGGNRNVGGDDDPTTDWEEYQEP